MNDDKRFTNGLIVDVVSALEKHGYKNTDVRAMGQFVGGLLELAQTFEGTPSSRMPSLMDSCPPECECSELKLLTEVLNRAKFALLASIKGTPEQAGDAMGALSLACRAHWDWQTERINNVDAEDRP